MIFDRFRKKSDKPEPPPVSRPVPDPSAETTEFLTGDPAIDRRSLHLLLDTMAEVGSTIELDRLLIDLVDKSIETTRSERGFLLLVNGNRAAPGEEPQIDVRVARIAGGRDLPLESVYSKSVARRVLTSGEPVVNIVQSSQDALDLGQSVYDLKLRAVMCVPLAARGHLSGAIYVDSRAERQEFTKRDLAFFAALAQQLAVSIENARLYQESLERVRLSKEMELANKIQVQLLPRPTGLPVGVEAETWFRAAEAAAGDTFDVLATEDGSVAALLGDVAGHGIGSALIAHSVQSALRSYLEVLPDLGAVVRRTNTRFLESVEAGRFMSLIVVRLAPSPGGAWRLHYLNAGHGGAYIVRKDGARPLATSGPALGMVHAFDYRSGEPQDLMPGDILFLCSDGLTEARNVQRDMLGEARLLEVLSGGHGGSAAALIARARGCLEQHLGTAACDDDVMMLALGLGAPGG